MPAQHRRRTRRTRRTGRTRRRKNRNLFSRKRNNISYRLNYSLKRGGGPEEEAEAKRLAEAAEAAEAKRLAEDERIRIYVQRVSQMAAEPPPGVYHEGTAEWKAQQHGDPYVPEHVRLARLRQSQQQTKQPKTRTMWYDPKDPDPFKNHSPSDFFG